MTVDESVDTSIINESLQKVAKGAGIVFIGNIAGVFFLFVTRVLIARTYTQEEYGIFSLGFTILNIFVILGTFGLQDGTARQIAYYWGKKKNDKAGSVISYSILFSILVGIILFLLLFFSSDIIAIGIFNLSQLSPTLKILSIAIPFFVLIYVFIAIFRGFGSVKEKAIFQDFMRNLLFLSLLFLIIWTGFSFEWTIITYSISVTATSLSLIFYFMVKKRFFINYKLFRDIDISIGVELLLFSLPLLLVTILYQLMGWTDTLMIGYFKSAELVGLYNAASPLGRFISAALASMVFIYMPIASVLYVRNKIYEMKRSYAILTKWVCTATLPLVMIFVFFPNVVINFLFGRNYISAGTVLQILSIGFFINNLMGPNGATLTAIGKTKFLMYTTFAAACINVLLNILLIPRYGINGAAAATVIALVSVNIVRSIKLYSISKIHSLEKNILKPIILSIILIFIIYFIAKNLLKITLWVLPFLFILFIVLYVFSLLITKSFDKEDIDMVIIIEKKIGMKSRVLENILEKFC